MPGYTGGTRGTTPGAERPAARPRGQHDAREGRAAGATAPKEEHTTRGQGGGHKSSGAASESAMMVTSNNRHARDAVAMGPVVRSDTSRERYAP